MTMEAKVVSLVNNSKYKDFLFNSNRKYIVPEYQRAYSWGEKQLEDFVESIERSLYGEQIFMGTVQFARENDEYHIIDGQQRLTTFLLFYRLLDLIDGEEDKYIKEYLDIIDVRNFSSNQVELKKVLSLNYEDINLVGRSKKSQKEFWDNDESRYLKNIRLLKTLLVELLEEHSIKNEDEKKDFILQMQEAIAKNVYFVELITVAIPLPQVVGIFNTINTTGLDLDCSDLFKLQYFEYLKKATDNQINWMKEISDCYEFVNQNNLNMGVVLDIYKHCIVAKYDLGWEYLQKTNEAFYDGILTDLKFRNSDILKFDEFKRIVSLCCVLFKDFDNEKSALRMELEHKDKMLVFTEKLIEVTRYSRYWTLPYVYAVFRCNDKDNEQDRNRKFIEALRFGLKMAKYFIVFSVAYDKVINPVQTYICGTILPYIAGITTEKTKNIKDFDDEINRHMKRNPYVSFDDYNSNNKWKQWFEDRIVGNIYENGKRTRILCTLSALLEDIKVKKTPATMKLLYNWTDNKYDIDHIYARKQFETTYPNDLALFNSIGNLVVLEASKNRAIHDYGFVAKQNCNDKNNKFVVYKSSEYEIVKNITNVVEKNNYSWDKKDVEQRLEEEKTKLINFIFN